MMEKENDRMTLDQVLRSEEVVSRWDDTVVSIVENGNVLFRLSYNTEVQVDIVGFIVAGEFTGKIKNYLVVDVNITENTITINVKENKIMDNRLQDAISFLQGEADQLLEFKIDEDKLAEYIESNDLEEGYGLRTYLDNTFDFVYDQVSSARGYDKDFANYILDIVDAYYAGGSAYVEGDVEAECGLLVEALEYVIIKLKEGGLK